jgi:ABC-2 type transport system ATP-binding protein
MAQAAMQTAATLGDDAAYISVKDLVKTYPNGTKAVRGISFQVRKGEIFGILGPNGAGKSTTIGVLGTLVKPTSGEATVAGFDVRHQMHEIRKRMGFAMQEAGVDDLATGREYLYLQGRLYGVPKDKLESRSAQLLKVFELEAAADKRIGSYSGGMKRRIDLASALIHFPPILFLDEPTEGLDPRSRMAMWRVLQRLRQQLKTTIILSTHYMEEADRLCDRIAIIDQGTIAAIDTPARLKASVGGQSLILEYPLSPEKVAKAETVLSRARLVNRVQRTATSLNCYVDDAAGAAPKVLRALEAAKLSPESLKIQQPSLDDAYLKYTGRKIGEAEEKPTENGGKKK